MIEDENTQIPIRHGGIFFRLWASTNLGAKKGKKKRGENSPATTHITHNIHCHNTSSSTAETSSHTSAEGISSKSLQGTGEPFDIINPTHAPSQVGDDSDVEDEELDRMAAAAADDLSDDELDAGVEAAIDMPPSSIWLSKLTWRNRSTERMRSNDEWEDFKDNIGI